VNNARLYYKGPYFEGPTNIFFGEGVADQRRRFLAAPAEIGAARISIARGVNAYAATMAELRQKQLIANLA